MVKFVVPAAGWRGTLTMWANPGWRSDAASSSLGSPGRERAHLPSHSRPRPVCRSFTSTLLSGNRVGLRRRRPSGARSDRVVLAGDAWIADGNYHETLDLRIELADTVVVLDMPWWLCSGRALRRGFRMPGELPEGCDYSTWARLRDEWRLAGRIWRKRHVEPAHEREVILEHGQNLAVHVLRSKRAVSDFLDGVHADRGAVDEN